MSYYILFSSSMIEIPSLIEIKLNGNIICSGRLENGTYLHLSMCYVFHLSASPIKKERLIFYRGFILLANFYSNRKFVFPRKIDSSFYFLAITKAGVINYTGRFSLQLNWILIYIFFHNNIRKQKQVGAYDNI